MSTEYYIINDCRPVMLYKQQRALGQSVDSFLALGVGGVSSICT